MDRIGGVVHNVCSPPSDPQIYVGDEMAAKLPKLEATLRARRSGGTI